MKRAIVGLTVLWLACLAAPAWAAPDATLSATAPTQYEDGTMIPTTDTLTYKVYCGSAQGNYPFVFDAPNLDTGTTIDISACVAGSPGTYYFVATATSTVHVTESGWSNETSRVYTASDLGKTPLAPTLLTIG